MHRVSSLLTWLLHLHQVKKGKWKVCWQFMFKTCIACINIAETWTSLVQKLPTELLEGIDDLPGVLVKRCCDLSAFRQITEIAQIVLLNNTLGEESLLIPQILEHVKVSTAIYSMQSCMSFFPF